MRTTLRSDSQRGVTRPLLVLRRISESAGRASGATRTSERIRCGNQEPGVEVLELLIPERCEESAHTNATGSDSSERPPHARSSCRKLSPLLQRKTIHRGVHRGVTITVYNL